MEIVWSPGTTLEDVEEQVITSAFRFYETKTATANALGISIRTIDNKLKKYEDKKAKIPKPKEPPIEEYVAE